MQTASAMIEALQASQPQAELVEKLELFGQFVGSWDVEVINYKPDGSQQSVPGEWHFGWVLDGRAIQDVWIAPKRSLRTGNQTVGEYGATLRFYDPKIDAWRSTWIGPARGWVLPFIARQIADEIILGGDFAPNASRRWIFSEITADSFHWRAIESTDLWATHRKVQEMFATRRRSESSRRKLHRTKASSMRRHWINYAAGVWSILFAAPHTWWALGIPFGFPGGEASYRFFMSSNWRYVYDLVVIFLSAVGVFVALTVPRPPHERVRRWLTHGAAWIALVLLTLRGVAGFIHDGLSDRIWNPTFLIGGILFGCVVWLARKQPHHTTHEC